MFTMVQTKRTSDDVSVIIADKDGVEMQPTYSMGGYRGSRFELIEIILN